MLGRSEIDSGKQRGSLVWREEKNKTKTKTQEGAKRRKDDIQERDGGAEAGQHSGTGGPHEGCRYGAAEWVAKGSEKERKKKVRLRGGRKKRKGGGRTERRGRGGEVDRRTDRQQGRLRGRMGAADIQTEAERQQQTG